MTSSADADTIDAVAELFLAGWVRADMRSAFPWVDDDAVLAAWSRLTFDEQFGVLFENYPDEQTVRAVDSLLFEGRITGAAALDFERVAAGHYYALGRSSAYTVKLERVAPERSRAPLRWVLRVDGKKTRDFRTLLLATQWADTLEPG